MITTEEFVARLLTEQGLTIQSGGALSLLWPGDAKPLPGSYDYASLANWSISRPILSNATGFGASGKVSALPICPSYARSPR